MHTQTTNHIQPHRTAFTLVELLVVISVIMLVLAIAAPTLTKYYDLVRTAMSQSTVNQLHAACYTYRGDFGDFPTSTYTPPLYGYNWLTCLLAGYADNPGTPGQPTCNLAWDDGCSGPGFRTTYRGKVYGPYGGAEKLARSFNPANMDPNFTVFIDAFRNTICYYKYNPQALLYNLGDSPGVPDLECFKDYEITGGSQNSPYYRYDFILATPGADGIWWPGPNRQDASGLNGTFNKIDDPIDNGGSDDVTNMLLNGRGHSYADVAAEHKMNSSP